MNRYSSREVIKILTDDGWYEVNCSGDHHQFKHPIKESLIKSRLTAWHASCLHIFRHLAQKILDRRQPACGFFGQPDEKSDGAICAPDLISASLKRAELQ